VAKLRNPVTLQLAHRGAKGIESGALEAASRFRCPEAAAGRCAVALEHQQGETKPSALDSAGLARIRTAFAASTKRAARLASTDRDSTAHTGICFTNSFRLSPIAGPTNTAVRSPTAARFPLEVFDAVRAAFRRQAGRRESIGNGLGRRRLGPRATIEFAKALKQRGAD